jgi:hypothetical protein
MCHQRTLLYFQHLRAKSCWRVNLIKFYLPLTRELTGWVYRCSRRAKAMVTLDQSKQSAEAIGSAPRKSTYFSLLTARGYVLIALFVILFYFLCFLHAKNRIGAAESGVVLGAYWLSSLCFFANQIRIEFPFMYKFVLRRMRAYSATKWFFGVYVTFTVLIMPYLYMTLSGYGECIDRSLGTYSIKSLIGAYGCSIFYVFVLYIAICNVVARRRRTQYSNEYVPNI